MAARQGLSLSRLPVAAKVAVGALFAFIVGLAYVVIFYSDASSAIRSAQSQESALRKRLADARKTEFAYQQDLADLNERQQRQRELNKALPETTAFPAFLSSLQGVANVSGVSLYAWAPLDEIPEQFYAKVPMKLQLSGRFHQIAKFFYGVGQLDRIVNIENIVLKDPKREGDDLTLSVECLATAFRVLSPEAAAQVQAKGAAAKKPGGK